MILIVGIMSQANRVGKYKHQRFQPYTRVGANVTPRDQMHSDVNVGVNAMRRNQMHLDATPQEQMNSNQVNAKSLGRMNSNAQPQDRIHSNSANVNTREQMHSNSGALTFAKTRDKPHSDSGVLINADTIGYGHHRAPNEVGSMLLRENPMSRGNAVDRVSSEFNFGVIFRTCVGKLFQTNRQMSSPFTHVFTQVHWHRL